MFWQAGPGDTPIQKMYSAVYRGKVSEAKRNRIGIYRIAFSPFRFVGNQREKNGTKNDLAVARGRRARVKLPSDAVLICPSREPFGATASAGDREGVRLGGREFRKVAGRHLRRLLAGNPSLGKEHQHLGPRSLCCLTRSQGRLLTRGEPKELHRAASEKDEIA